MRYVSRAYLIFCNSELQQKTCDDATGYKRVHQLFHPDRKEFNRWQVRLFQINLEYTDNYVQISHSLFTDSIHLINVTKYTLTGFDCWERRNHLVSEDSKVKDKNGEKKQVRVG